ncbi:TAM domain methyltransferase [Colletotrichum navitas]|uniref:TAM domain methyltransferase n=1 Tax=Colletotrichum navitas TaxID=681940 RepID=A0AAD8V3E4_9PEZI|nr:TAM domain methyltransferase [Colletotrichum navitas]KAK1590730.1 TAM domain methyltransferase [Colletotrichum navitas]
MLHLDVCNQTQHEEMAAAAAAPPLEPDTFDSDSAISAVANISTDSPTPSVVTFEEENGRTYHSMSPGKYPFPNDTIEQERLALQHQIWDVTLNHKLCLCPKNYGRAKNVLDAGTGTGLWAIDYADAHPEAKVTGVDLSSIQPKWIPPNLSWEMDDLEMEWTWPQRFDFIFARMLVGSLCDYQDFVNKAFDNLEPGGYLEMQDMCLPYRCDDGTLTNDNPIKRLSDVFTTAGKVSGRRMDLAWTYATLMRNAGFVDVVETQYKWPVNGWPRDPHYKTLGVLTQHNLDHGLEGLTLGLTTRNLGWTRQETLLFCSEVRKALKSHGAHAYAPIYVIYGRKPEETAQDDQDGQVHVDMPPDIH